MNGMPQVAWNAHNAFTQWKFGPFVLTVAAVLVGAGLSYLRSEWAMAASGRRWPGIRTASFLTGLLTVDLALQSPVAAFTADYFQAHIIQHLLLMLIAPTLLCLGAPLTLYLEARPRGARPWPLRLARSRTFRVLSHPVPVWFLYYFSMFAFFLTSALNFAMLHMWVMDLINIGFLLSALLFWWPLVGSDPVFHWSTSAGARLTNLVIGIPVESFLALALISDRHPAASMYTISSTRSGAELLWVAAELLTLVAIVPVFAQWLREERRALRFDLRLNPEPALAFNPKTSTPDKDKDE